MLWRMKAMAAAFEAAACSDAGAADARPMVRQLHEVWRSREEAKAAAQAAAAQLTAAQHHLCTVASVLERLSVSLDGLVRVVPATLAVLIRRCQGAVTSLEVEFGVAPPGGVGSGSESLPAAAVAASGAAVPYFSSELLYGGVRSF